MIRNIKERYSDWIEGSFDSKRWGNDLTVMCTNRDQLPYAQKCIDYLDSLSKDMENELINCLMRYYNKLAELLFEEDLEEIGPITKENVLNHISLGTLCVDEDCRQDRIEFHVEGECDWEIEHGLEITISDGKILYVGMYEDNPPYLKSLQPEQAQNDEWNFAVNRGIE